MSHFLLLQSKGHVCFTADYVAPCQPSPIIACASSKLPPRRAVTSGWEPCLARRMLRSPCGSCPAKAAGQQMLDTRCGREQAVSFNDPLARLARVCTFSLAEALLVCDGGAPVRHPFALPRTLRDASLRETSTDLPQRKSVTHNLHR